MKLEPGQKGGGRRTEEKGRGGGRLKGLPDKVEWKSGGGEKEGELKMMKMRREAQTSPPPFLSKLSSSLPTTIRSRSLACYDEEESPILFLQSPRKELSFFSRPNKVILLDVVAEYLCFLLQFVPDHVCKNRW